MQYSHMGSTKLPNAILLTEILRKKNNRVCFDKSSQGVDAIEAGEAMMRESSENICAF